MSSVYALGIGFLLDLMFGDPHWMPHPVRLIGLLISGLEKLLRRLFPKSNKGELAAGIVLAVLVIGLSTLVPALLLFLCGLVHPVLRFCVEAFMCYQILATKALKTESMKVYKKLKKGTLKGARKAVSMIVGRDTEHLSDVQVAKAAVETVAENTSDGIVAPLLFLAIGGAPLGFFYKAINTMDSMIGYRNEKYLYFGRFAAKLDDVVNFIPARISAWLMILSSFLLGMDGKSAARIYRRDRFNHSSPNSAHTEAVCAGALNIQLAGDAWYFGKLHKKPTLGDPVRPVEYEDIPRSNRLLYLTAVLSLALFGGVKLLILFIL